jgi:multiple sugar transport system substrate-binding protein
VPALASCAPKQTASQVAAPTATPAPLQFLMCCASAAVYKLMEDTLIPSFKAKHPHVSEVSIQTGNAAEARPKLAAQLAAGQPPDVLRFNWPHHDLATSKALADLTPIVNKDRTLDLKDFYPRITDFYRQPKISGAANALWAFPQNYACESLYYNRTALRAAGVPEPDDNWTWDDLVTHGRRLKSSGPDVWGVEVRTIRIDHILWAYGGGFVDDTGSKVTVGEPASIQALEYIGDLFTRHQIQPTSADLQGVAGGMATLFNTGKLGFQFAPENNVVRNNLVTGLDYDVAPVPKGPRGRFTFFFPGGVTAMAGSKHPVGAYDLAKWFAIDPYVIDEFIWKTGGSPTARISLNERFFKQIADRPSRRETVLKNPDFGKTPYFLYRKGDEAMDLVNATLPDVWNGTRRAREVALELQSRLSTLFQS